jgi:hydrogenase maturation protein HypF
MLPYTPLHYILFAGQNARLASDTLTDIVLPPLVMTSGNLSEEPIATDNQEARLRLASLADAFLMHNRPINTRCDDSVTRAHPQIPAAGEIGNPKIETPILLRRARGYAPFPILVHFESPPLLATGPELKNTFCLLRGRYALLSQHIGDLENYETLNSFEQGILHYQQLFRIQPELIAYDLHPNYLATRYALERGERESIPLVGVQHHHAHVAAAMVEHGIETGEEVIGIAFDGTGFGEDGSIWGGEFLVASYERSQRWAHFAYMPLPGGDAAIRKPARIALAYLWNADLEWDLNLPPLNSLSGEEKAVLRSMLENNMNIVQTSSIGRLFDAVSALLGIRQVVNYEAQAAIELEAVVDPTEDGCYQCKILNPEISSTPLSDSRITDTGSIIRQIHADVLTGSAIPTIAARFHNTLAKLVLDVCQEIRIEQGIQKVVLSGGVWQNMTLLKKTLKLLFKYDFQVYTHRRVPPNDGCIALGQAAIAYHRSHEIMS